MIQGALIGFGQVAEEAHAPAWKDRKDFRIVAVVDERPERARLAASVFPGTRVYSSIDELFRSEAALEFVDIATPPFLHGRQVLAALERGIHVLCEKPLVLTPEELGPIAARARSQDRSVFCVHNWKYAPIFMQAARLIRSRAVGSVKHVELHTLRQKPAADANANSWRTDPRRSGGGVLVDHGWHNFYLLRTLVNAEPRAVSTRLSIPGDDGVDHEAACLVDFPTASGSLYLSWSAPERANWGVIYGTEGSLELLDDLLLLKRRNAEVERFAFSEKLSHGSAHSDWFKTLLEDFRDEIENPAARHQSLREAESCLRLLMSAYRSHSCEGETVRLPPLDETRVFA